MTTDSASQDAPLILEAHEDGVTTLTFNDPDHLNAMTRRMGEAFADRLARLGSEPGVRAVVLTGSGRAFSAGGDFGMLNELAADGRARPGIARRGIRDTMRSFYKLFLSVRDLPCPTIAAINGPAIGAGFCVALACDMRFIAEEAKVGLNFTKLGVHPGMAATWTLPRLVGPAIAAELLYTSRLIRGAEAASMGLANRALAKDQVLATATEVAREIASCSPIAVQGTKRSLVRSLDATLEDQLSFEASEQAVTFETEDVHEGLAAVQAKRAPKFEGR
jgi:enoyl-CoA hydratase